MNRRKPITTFEELAEHVASHALSQRKAIVVQGGAVHMVGRSDVDGIELGGRVADELEQP